MLKSFLLNYGWIIVLLLAFLFYVMYVYKKQGKTAAFQIARETAFKLMLAAQKKFGQDAGEQKFKWVVERFYLMLPDTAKFIFSEKDIEKYLQKIYVEFMDFLDNGKIDDSFKEQFLVPPKKIEPTGTITEFRK